MSGLPDGRGNNGIPQCFPCSHQSSISLFLPKCELFDTVSAEILIEESIPNTLQAEHGIRLFLTVPTPDSFKFVLPFFLSFDEVGLTVADFYDFHFALPLEPRVSA